MTVVISSGHGKHVRGAVGYLDEVNEARRVVEQVALLLRNAGVKAITFHDDTSTSQSENLNTIVAFHNKQTRDLDVSIHFNAYETTAKPMGCEVLFVTQEDLARELSANMAAAAELPNRGAKYRDDLAFLNGTEEPAVLVETCFVDSSTDAEHYRDNFDRICTAIAEVIGEVSIGDVPPPIPPDAGFLVQLTGKVSWFGGPQDDGVDADEGLAFFYDYEDAPHLFLDEQPIGTTGLARRLNPELFYVACRWDYDVTSKDMLSNPSRQAIVVANGREFLAWPADWGPHGDTDRVADISPGLMDALGINTDGVVEVLYPAPQR
jgi:N-acetylmuramoyl-L-alanine amidase